MSILSRFTKWFARRRVQSESRSHLRRRRRGRLPSALNRRLPPAPVGGAASRVVVTKPSDILDRFRSHPGFGAGPETITGIFRQAEHGFPELQADLFEDLMENDGHLTSIINSRVIAVAGKPWQVQAGGDQPIDLVAAKMLETALRRTNFADMLDHQLRARYYGYSVSEIVWDFVDDVVAPAWFVNVPWRRIRFDNLERPLLRTDEAIGGIPLEAGKWVMSCNTASGLVARSGLMRTASWWALFKRMCTRDWVIFCEKFGIPLVYGLYDEDSDDADIDALEQAVTDLGEAGQAVLPKIQEIKIEHSAQRGDSDTVFGALVNLCNTEMSKLIAGATLNVETQGQGSFAQAKTHQDRGFDLVSGDAEWFGASSFERDISRPFLAFNGLDAAPPRLKVAVARNMDPLTRAKIADIMANKLGMKLDEDQMRQEFQFKEPTGEGLGGMEQPSPTGPPPTPGGDGDEEREAI